MSYLQMFDKGGGKARWLLSHNEYLTTSDCFGLILNKLSDNNNFKKKESQEDSSFLIWLEKFFFLKNVKMKKDEEKF